MNHWVRFNGVQVFQLETLMIPAGRFEGLQRFTGRAEHGERTVAVQGIMGPASASGATTWVQFIRVWYHLPEPDAAQPRGRSRSAR